eukprot:Gregarina_sp_Poly_1__4716@NODE_251_length_10668_cov_46_370814_g33_i1_p1_GENE_NODE_251_length_10668_cov_46_370814_g33_i1NODE_251_length_10668_cov_46_370814_g33_i1_p1_ORF_typecomplete_len1951_score322_90Sec7/PF01369_20/1_1e50Sec7/PF01369_20/7_6e03Sec7/PF01369_20/1_2e04Sec7_N/PF12783_7/8_1e16Sec7_N/PF12783_7/8_7e02Sec7_N/PF12783_7/2e03Sec7_N/PF12783_7/7_7e03DUF1981/PF09324_10/2_7e03DUF1981/PF09324_10/7_2e03DUF1981/PF09324_10/4_6e05Headcase/PF16002_5/0_11CLASP_N/PF12348_8/4_6e02CLASP_N/PF12348_8/0_4
MEKVAIMDESTVHLQLMKTLKSLIVSKDGNCCHGSNLTKVVQFFLKMHSENKNPSIQRAAEEILISIVKFLLEDLESSYRLALCNDPCTSGPHEEAQSSDPVWPAKINESLEIPEFVSTPLRQAPGSESPGNEVITGSSRSRSIASPSPTRKFPITPSINGQNLTLALKKSPALVRGLQDLMQITNMLTSVIAKGTMETEDNQKATRLSLDLLSVLLSRKGTLIKHTSAFVDLLRSHLIHILLKATICVNSKLSATASTLYTSLLGEFRKNLITEAAFFIDSIFLKLFGSSASSFDLKMRLLKSVMKVVTDCHTLQRLYLHHDCSVNRPPIVRKLFAFLTSIMSSSSADLGCSSSSQLSQLKDEICVLLGKSLSSMLEWFDSTAQLAQASEISESATDNKVTIQMDLPSWLHTTAATYIAQGNDHFEYQMKGISEESMEPSQILIKHTRSPIEKCLSRKGIEFSKLFSRRLLVRQVLYQSLAQFQTKPEKGYARLWDLEILPRSTDAIAKFILNSELNHDKTALGIWLGNPTDESAEVLKKILQGLNFGGDEIDIALRKFLRLFRLPGEAQKIDRIVESFSLAFCRDNPTHVCFGSNRKVDDPKDDAPPEDLAYIVAFSVIMLHTDAHSKEIKPENKMTKEEFVKNNQGMKGGYRLPTELLEGIFDRIVAEEWMMEDDSILNSTQTMKGPAGDQEEPFSATGTIAGALGLGGGNRRKLQQYQQEADAVNKRIDHWISKMNKLHNPPPIEKDFWKEATQRERVALLPMLVKTLSRFFRSALNIYTERHPDTETPSLVGALDAMLALARLAARLNLTQEKEEVLGSLAVRSEIFNRRAPLKCKQCLALSRLLLFMHSDVELVGRAWSVILPCLSEIDRAQAITSKSVLIKASLTTSMGQYAGSLPPSIAVYNGLLPPDWMEMPAVKALYGWWERSKGSLIQRDASGGLSGIPNLKRVDTSPAQEIPSSDQTEGVTARRVSSSVPAALAETKDSRPIGIFLKWPLGPNSWTDSPFCTDPGANADENENWEQDSNLASIAASSASYLWVDELRSAETLENFMENYETENPFAIPQRLSFESLVLFFHYYLQVSCRELKAPWKNQYGLNESNVKHYLPRNSSLSRPGGRDGCSPADRSTRLSSLHRILDLAGGLLNFKAQAEAEALMKSYILPHLQSVALHPDQTVALCACDILKQIAMSVLDSHPTLDQVLFLSPFPSIFSESSELTREFLIKVCFNLVKTRGSRLGTGWASILGLLAAKIPTSQTVHEYDLRDTAIATRERLLLGFKTLETSVDLHSVPLLNHFEKLMNTFSSFIKIFIPFPTTQVQTFTGELDAGCVNKDAPLEKLSNQALSIVHAYARVVSCDTLVNEHQRLGSGGGSSRIARSKQPLSVKSSFSSVAPDETPLADNFQMLYIPQGLYKLDACHLDPIESYGASTAFFAIHAIAKGPGIPANKKGSILKCPYRQTYIDCFMLPILMSLADLIQAPAITLNLRWKGVDIMFSLLETGGNLIFDETHWISIFENLLFPLFEALLQKLDAKQRLVPVEDFFTPLKVGQNSVYFSPTQESNDGERSYEWASRTATLLYRSVLSLLMMQTSLANDLSLFACLLKVLGLFWTSTSEPVARIGQEMFENMIKSLGKILLPQQWTLCTDFCLYIWKESEPAELLEPPDLGAQPERVPLDHSIIMSKSVLQLLLIDGISTCLIQQYIEVMPLDSLLRLLKQLEDSYSFARLFNSQLSRRRKLQLKGFMASLTTLPGLMKQERDSLVYLLRSLTRISRMLGESVVAISKVREVQGSSQDSSRESLATRLDSTANSLGEPVMKQSMKQIMSLDSVTHVLWDAVSRALLDITTFQVQQYRDALKMNKKQPLGDDSPMEFYVKSEAERELTALHRVFEEVIIPELAVQSSVFFEFYAHDLYVLFADCFIFESPSLRMSIREMLLAKLQLCLFPK